MRIVFFSLLLFCSLQINAQIDTVHVCTPTLKEDLPGFSEASFPGGKDSLTAFTQRCIPASMKGSGVITSVYIDIDSSGKIHNVRVIQQENCNENCAAFKIQAEQIIANMPTWEPSSFINEKHDKVSTKSSRIISIIF